MYDAAVVPVMPFLCAGCPAGKQPHSVSMQRLAAAASQGQPIIISSSLAVLAVPQQQLCHTVLHSSAGYHQPASAANGPSMWTALKAKLRSKSVRSIYPLEQRETMGQPAPSATGRSMSLWMAVRHRLTSKSVRSIWPVVEPEPSIGTRLPGGHTVSHTQPPHGVAEECSSSSSSNTAGPQQHLPQGVSEHQQPSNKLGAGEEGSSKWMILKTKLRSRTVRSIYLVDDAAAKPSTAARVISFMQHHQGSTGDSSSSCCAADPPPVAQQQHYSLPAGQQPTGQPASAADDHGRCMALSLEPGSKSVRTIWPSLDEPTAAAAAARPPGARSVSFMPHNQGTSGISSCYAADSPPVPQQQYYSLPAGQQPTGQPASAADGASQCLALSLEPRSKSVRSRWPYPDEPEFSAAAGLANRHTLWPSFDEPQSSAAARPQRVRAVSFMQHSKDAGNNSGSCEQVPHHSAQQLCHTLSADQQPAGQPTSAADDHSKCKAFSLEPRNKSVRIIWPFLDEPTASAAAAAARPLGARSVSFMQHNQGISGVSSSYAADQPPVPQQQCYSHSAGRQPAGQPSPAADAPCKCMALSLEPRGQSFHSMWPSLVSYESSAAAARPPMHSMLWPSMYEREASAVARPQQ